jgi:hypothetical protein
MKEIFSIPTHELKDLEKKHPSHVIEPRLRKIVEKIWPDESHILLREKLIDLDKAGTISLLKAMPCWNEDPRTPLVKSIAGMGPELVKHYICATIYSARAKKFIKEEEHAKLFIHAFYHLGALEWHIEAFDAKVKNVARAKRAGTVRGEKIKLVTNEITRLLSLPPKSGWRAMDQTAEALTIKVDEFIIREKLGSIIYGTYRFIRKTLSEGEANIAYHENKIKNRTNTKPNTGSEH